MLEKIKEVLREIAKSEYQNILLLTTSNRSDFHAKPRRNKSEGELSKSTYLAYKIKDFFEHFDKPKTIDLIEVPLLNIYPCEGNVSGLQSKGCGVKQALLKDRQKNPTGYHRCWASLNNPDDELWKISKKLFESDLVIFFASTRWGQTNSIYQKLIERLTWIENRHSQLEESKIKLPSAGIIVFGQNWKVDQVVKTQAEVLEFFGFPVVDQLLVGWQASQNSQDESREAYEKGIKDWMKAFGCQLYQKRNGELDV